MLHVTDHLGSVAAVVRGSDGALYEASEYDAYGKRSSLTSAGTVPVPEGVTLRDGFTGKEDQAPDFAVPYLDFGARQYSPALRRWLVPDPMSEKYYGISPYAYCKDNPICRIDHFGMDDYRYDDTTGQFHLMEPTNDKSDRVLGYHINRQTGEYEKNTKWHQNIVRIEGIEKGILSDGVDFMNNTYIVREIL